MALKSIRITSDGHGYGDLIVDGHDISGVTTAAHLTVQAKETPKLIIETVGGLDVEIEGVVEVVREPTFGEVMKVSAEWLEGLDPESVRAVLAGETGTMRQDPIAAVIKVLAASAREVAD